MTMLTLTRRGQPGAVHLAAPTRPELTVDDRVDMATELLGLAGALRYHDDDAPSTELPGRLVLAADDLLTAAAWLAVDPAPYIDVRELVGL